MKIIIDADACPVTEETITEAKKYNIPVLLVKSFAHFSPFDQQDGVETIYVDSEAEAADYKIMQQAKRGDLIVTQDYGLASLTLPKGCTVIHQKGFLYSEKNIDQLLQSRYVNAMARKSGQRTKGPKAFTVEDRKHYAEKLQTVINNLLS
ncbi:YaiI/YqxD family protein [Alkalibacillus haloalkaliphilus]|uniref:YaiI/YqxD family protein n=1 Tax=Alkalibacillus haloalkaliphilus TaxID=94136 RepID=UPI0002F6CB18|nr:YaiI/YqxD family protein [Alkalibacillus haloalkaliphilus]